MKGWIALGVALVWLPLAADELEDYVNAKREELHIPGLVVATVRDGKVDRVVASGMASLDLSVPVRRDTVFEIGSLTKAFTAMLTMMMVEEGKLSLADPVSKHLSQTPDIWKDITLRHLLTHTSGLPNYTAIRPALVINGQRTNFDEVFEMVKDKFLQFDPGEQYQYSNTNYYFLGRIVELASGDSFSQLLKSRILDPLEMRDTGPQRQRSVVKNRAVGYIRAAQGHTIMPYLDGDGAWAAGYLVSTVDDMAKWDAALREQKLLKPESYKELYTAPKITQGTSTYALGWDVGMVGTRRVILHGGGTGGFSSFIYRLPDDPITVIVLSNLGQADVGAIARGVARIVMPELVEKPIRDPDEEITKRHRAIIDKILDGTIDRAPFSQETADALFPTLIAQSRLVMQSFGKFEGFELLEHKQEPEHLTRRYRGRFEKETVVFTISENRDKKIVGIFMRGE